MHWYKFHLQEHFLFLCINNMSFIKWVGGKSALMSHINKYIEEYISKNINEKSIYVEPFLGSVSINQHIKELF